MGAGLRTPGMLQVRRVMPAAQVTGRQRQEVRDDLSRRARRGADTGKRAGQRPKDQAVGERPRLTGAGQLVGEAGSLLPAQPRSQLPWRAAAKPSALASHVGHCAAR
jgi:hypothetical protein